MAQMQNSPLSLLSCFEKEYLPQANHHSVSDEERQGISKR